MRAGRCMTPASCAGEQPVVTLSSGASAATGLRPDIDETARACLLGRRGPAGVETGPVSDLPYLCLSIGGVARNDSIARCAKSQPSESPSRDQTRTSS